MKFIYEFISKMFLKIGSPEPKLQKSNVLLFEISAVIVTENDDDAVKPHM